MPIDLLRKNRIRKKSTHYGALLHARGLANKLAGAEERAEELFRKSQKIFLEIRDMMDWLRVSLDLIELYMHHQRWGHVRILAAEMIRYADDTETIVAIRAFREAVAAEPFELTKEILTAVYKKIHGDARPIPLVVAPQSIDEFDVEKLGW